MAKPHKYAWNGLDAETSLSIETIANMAQRAALESTGDLLKGKQRIVSAGSTDRAIEFRINDFLVSFNKLLVFTLRFTEASGRVFASTSIDWYLTTQSTVGGFIPVSAKTMTAHHTFMQFVHNLAGQISAADPTARIIVREGVQTQSAPSPAPPPSAAPAPPSPAIAPPVVSTKIPSPAPPPPPPPAYPAGAPRFASPSPPIAPPQALPGGGSGLVTGVPGIRSSQPAPPPPAPPPPPAAPPPPHPPVALAVSPLAAQMFSDDDDLEATRIGQASGRVRPWRLVLGDGRQVAASASPLVLGRGPVAPPMHPDAAPIVVVDPVRSVSKSHALVVVDGGMLWVTDLHSTNGTKVTNELGEATSCPPGVSIPAGSGWTISLGEYAIQVVLGDAAEGTHI